MGAVHKLDLTSDVTHLVVGRIDTPKYQYVARERLDVKVLSPQWVQAVRDEWTEGGSVNLEALEDQYRLPTFFGLQICVTGFEDLDERSALAQSFTDNGAAYHGDLTKAVTHLVAASPQGKKYEYAAQWGIKTVTIEWVRQSITRGMALDETLFHPTTPAEQQGQGAVTRKQQPSPLGKRKHEQAQPTRNASDAASRARKLRRTASARYESQGDNLWADMGSAHQPEEQTAPGQEWDEDETPRKPSRERKAYPTPNPDSDGHNTTEGGQQERRLPNVQGIFNGSTFFVDGFPERHTTLLFDILTSNGGILLTAAQMATRPDESSNALVLVPHQTPYRRAVDQIPHLRPTDSILTEFWLEKCLSSKSFIDYNVAPLCRPFKVFPIPGFVDLVICPSSFAGVSLLHFKKVVELMGACYDESLHKQTSVLVCNDGKPNMSKLEYALENRIPVVHAEWFWQCITRCRVLPFARFIPQACQDYIKELHASRAATAEKTLTRGDADDLRPLSGGNDDFCNTKHDNLTTTATSQSNPALETASKQRKPLTELPPEVNSPKKNSSNSQSQPLQVDLDSAATLAHAPHDQNQLSKSKSALSLDDSMLSDPVTLQASEMLASTQNTPLNSAIAQLLAQRKLRRAKSTTGASAGTTQAMAANADSQPRRQRKLGRAASNPSSVASALSRQHSASQRPAYIVDDDAVDEDLRRAAADAVPEPSQRLTYEDPEALAARERVMKRMGAGAAEWRAQLEGADGRQRVESIGVVKDYSLAGEERRGPRRAVGRRAKEKADALLD